MLKKLDEEEQQASYAFSLRYVLNAKKPKFKKIFDKVKRERKIRSIFTNSKSKNQVKERVNAFKRVNEYFKNKKY